MATDEKPPLRVVALRAGRPDDGLVGLLERTLEKARAGELVAIWLVSEARCDGARWDVVNLPGCHPDALFGKLEVMKHRILYDHAKAEDR